MNVAAIKGNVEIINLLLERGFSADFKGSGASDQFTQRFDAVITMQL